MTAALTASAAPDVDGKADSQPVVGQISRQPRSWRSAHRALGYIPDFAGLSDAENISALGQW